MITCTLIYIARAPLIPCDMPRKPTSRTPDTGYGSLRKLFSLDATFWAALMTLVATGVCCWHPEWSGTLIPTMIVCVVLICAGLGWADAMRAPRIERSDSAEVHYTRRLGTVPNM